MLTALLQDDGFAGADPSMIPALRTIRRQGPTALRRRALEVLLHLGGEEALDPRDTEALRRLVAVKLPADRPVGIDACFNSWLAVRGGDRQGILGVLGLTRSAPATYALGETLLAHLAHGGPDDSRPWRHVFVSPELDGWTVLAGPSCFPAERWVRELSDAYGEAQSSFHGNQGDGEAWLAGVGGRIVRRFDSEEPETCTGEPLPIERRALDSLGLDGPPEALEDDDLWDFVAACGARTWPPR